jgi:acetylornithine deacetylase/succinyl-diaminopimelate desuccinylase-like protein
MDDLSRPTRHRTSEAPETPDLDRLGARLLARHAGLLRIVHDSDDRTLRDQMDVTAIPAPPFGEADRAAWMAERMSAYGADDVGIDACGNVVGHLRGTDPGAGPIVVSAHLDTVFPADTDVRPREQGDRILAPGISDDGRGLAALLTVTRLLAASNAAIGAPIILAATVGEEGLGDLRGVRALFEGVAQGASAFLSLDGAGVTRIVAGGLGSLRRRYRIRGPGGHSWVDWGRPNPIEIVGRALARLPRSDEMPAATTWSAGRIGGGTSINAIPETAWVEVEVRAERSGDLARADTRVRSAFEEAVQEAERTARRTGARGEGATRASLVVETIGDRPAGATPSDALLVGAAVAATRALGLPVELATSSTDANVPMALGIPALTLGAGGEAQGAHTLGEWYRNTLGPEGIVRALLTVLIWDAASSGRGRATLGEAAD